MNNKELLRPFDLTQAKAGAAIRWSYLDNPITFVGCTADGNIAIRGEDGTIEMPYPSSLRMKPLFWKEGRPVYKGDKLWHTLVKAFVIVDRLQETNDAEKKGLFFTPTNDYYCSALCLFEAPPQPLFILEGKPVFKGTRLWHKLADKWVTVTGVNLFGDFIDENGIGRSSSCCRWDKPTKKVVRYANVYSALLNSSRYIGELFTTPDGARGAPGSERSLGVVRIEWEE